VYTRDRGGNARIYLQGQAKSSNTVPGNCNSWNPEFRLILANELTGDRPWLGEFHLVAIYGRALSADEVLQNFAAGVKTTADYAALLPPAVERQVDFVRDVQPIFRDHCFECHAQGSEEGGLNLGVRARVMEGGENGPVLVRGKSGASRLIHLVAAVEKELVMPPEKDRLSPEQIGVLRAWIDQGAEWPAGADVLDPRAQQARSHWAFQRLQSVELPDVENKEWVRTPIDQFILAALESKGRQPSPPASARKLVRRMYFDVIGLPPSPDEMRRWEPRLTAQAARPARAVHPRG
jgi:mono/diheme cytochrome c family protein